jgi:hypothetical protein
MRSIGQLDGSGETIEQSFVYMGQHYKRAVRRVRRFWRADLLGDVVEHGKVEINGHGEVWSSVARLYASDHRHLHADYQGLSRTDQVNIAAERYLLGPLQHETQHWCVEFVPNAARLVMAHDRKARQRRCQTIIAPGREPIERPGHRCYSVHHAM